jgi:hypothetical protein
MSPPKTDFARTKKTSQIPLSSNIVEPQPVPPARPAIGAPKGSFFQLPRLPSTLELILRVGVLAFGFRYIWQSTRANKIHAGQWTMASVDGDDSATKTEDSDPAATDSAEKSESSAPPGLPALDPPATSSDSAVSNSGASTLSSLDSLLGSDSAAKESDAPQVQTKAEAKTKVQSTLADLDAMLGIDPEEEERAKDRKTAPQKQEPPTPAAQGSPSELSLAEQKLRETLGKMENAESVEDARLQTQELLDQLVDEQRQRRVPAEDVARMKKEVFKPTTFWVTTAEEAKEFPTTGFVGGHLFRGNLRTDREKAFEEVQRRTKEAFGDKYELLIIEEPPPYGEDGWMATPSKPDRPAFLLISASETKTSDTTTVQWVVSAVLILAALFTTYLTAFGAGLSEVDANQIQALIDSQNTGGLEELLDLNIANIARVAMPVGAGIASSALAHELAHRFAAAKNNVKLSPPYFIPNVQIGTLGGITSLKSLAPTRSALFDIAASGPVAGGTAALCFFLIGLFLSVTTTPGDPSLIPLSNNLIDSSLLIGAVVRGVLGDSPNLFCHPFLLAGWCGMITTALNTLPIGSTDGGRITQAVFGTKGKQLPSFLSYLGLGLDLLAPGFGLTWGLTTIFLQRGNERNVRDQFTDVDESRRKVALAMLVLTFLILVPGPGAFSQDFPAF